jgi:hypothetical protein
MDRPSAMTTTTPKRTITLAPSLLAGEAETSPKSLTDTAPTSKR